MSKFLKFSLLIIVTIITFNCSSDDDSTPPEEITLNDIGIELQFFNYTPPTNTVPGILKYEIKFTNSNSVGVIGFYSIDQISTTGSDTLAFSLLSTNLSPCYQIQANSSCTLSFNGETEINEGDENLPSPDLIEFVSASYRIDSTF